MSAIDRLNKFIDYQGETKYRFYKKTGLSNGFLDKNRNIGSDKCEIISVCYPDLNIEWLITGNGKMIKNGQIEESIGVGYNESESSEKVIKSDIISYKGGVPYYDVDFMNGFTSVEEIRHRNPEYLINYLPANQCDVWVNATGDSMQTLIHHGDTIALKQVDLEWFPLGEVYAIVTKNGHRMIKRITKSSKAGFYTLVSENKDKYLYPDQDIPKKQIYSLFKVVTAIKIVN